MVKKNNAILITTITLMLVLVFSATYAFFSTGTLNITNSSLLNTTLPSSTSTFTSYSNNPLALNVKLEDMVNASNVASVTDEGDLIVKLSSPAAGDQVYCTYDIRYIWDSTNQYTTPTQTLTSAYPFELSILGTATAVGDTTSSYTYSSKNLAENNLSSFTWNGTSGTAGRYATLISGAKIYSNTTSGTTVTWDFSLKFYTLPNDQSALVGKNYTGHLSAANIIC